MNICNQPYLLRLCLLANGTAVNFGRTNAQSPHWTFPSQIKHNAHQWHNIKTDKEKEKTVDLFVFSLSLTKFEGCCLPDGNPELSYQIIKYLLEKLKWNLFSLADKSHWEEKSSWTSPPRWHTYKQKQPPHGTWVLKSWQDIMEPLKPT